MGIAKQEFYEGAALHRLVRRPEVTTLRYQQPFFVINDRFLLTLKYSTKGRSPWAFTFMPAEQALLEKAATEAPLLIGLVCGADGVAGLPFEAYRTVAAPRDTAIHIACYRRHGKHYHVSGPDGRLPSKVPPSQWRRLIDREMVR
jgi:hypothetical protein